MIFFAPAFDFCNEFELYNLMRLIDKDLSMRT